MLTAYITDSHEAANFGIAFGFFALAYVVGILSALNRTAHPDRWPRRFVHAGLVVSGLLVICGLAMAAVWFARSDLIFRGDRPAARAVSAPDLGSSSSGSYNVTSNGSSGDFCSTHTCIGNFDSETGSMVQCSDGTFSHAGGLSGACSHHGGEASDPISAMSTGASAPGTSATESSRTTQTPPPTVPTYQPPPAPPVSQPRLTGATRASSGRFSFTVSRLVSQTDHDVPGNPRSFGVGFIASCVEPEGSITTWNLSSGGASYDSGTATCFQGTINPERMPVTITVTGCGDHVLTVMPMGFGDKIDGILKPHAAPMRFPFRVCQ